MRLSLASPEPTIFTANPRLCNNVNNCPKLSYAIQNCNSLNISTVCDKQLKKISAITTLDTDIILLCDLRLGTDAEPKNNISKLFRYNKSKSYEFFYNSSKSSRGVGILVSNSLNYKVLNILKDVSENILGITITIDRVKLHIFSVYGPNSNDFTLFSDLNNHLSEEPDTAVVIGGDWNATYSTSACVDNIDIFRMQSPSSITRSMWLNQVCRDFSLCDPYRALHPTTRDYTFTPHGTRANRLRIDFFLVGDELITILGKCNIGSCVGTTLFDQKSVLLDFKTEKKSSKMYINRSIISNPRTADIVAAAAADSYLHHAAPGQPHPAGLQQHVFNREEEDPIQAQKVTVGALLFANRNFNDIKSRILLEGETELLKLQLAAKNTEIAELREQLWNSADFAKLQLNCDYDVFLEVLLSNIKGAVISFQTWSRKVDNARKSKLIKEIASMRGDFILNADLIHEKEKALSELIEIETIAKVRQMKLFDCLNSEKPTPMFLSLARVSNSDKKLASIFKPDGNNFIDNIARNEYIVNYFKNVYERDRNEPENFSGCIERFLGNNVLASPMVRNSKLTETEKIDLDSPLTIQELDKSVEQSNLKSAPGIDWISGHFLKEFWPYIRHPLFNYCNCCLIRDC